MQNHRTIFVCQGTGCVSAGSDTVYEALKSELTRQGIRNAEVDLTGCHGFCEQGPNVVVEPEGIFYTHVQAEDAPEIVSSHLRDNKPVERLLYRDPVTGKAIPYYSEIKFYEKQQRVILRNCGHINPEKIEQYIAQGGYQALKKALLEMTPEQVIEEVKKSGLRGRGGAGFPTALKWEFCRNASGDKKYIICNADEGDPGAFMDRSILEADPHAVIEGLIIAGYAIGAGEGYIYVRAEYPLAVKRVHIALEQARESNFLGKDILGSGFSFTVHVKEGAGAFVCGEETALIASIESNRGMPRPRPPFPAQSGLDGKPTIINNVKSLASIPIIIDRKADWFANIGTEGSKGTAIFALTGKITNSGLVEVPMGTPLSSIIFDIGGGIPREKRFKAVQTGGPSGGCIPVQFLDTPVEYENLAKLGSIMGSGGMVVMDESTCMVEIARYFLSFTQDESCGKCAPCRLGTKQMLQILTRISQGKGHNEDLDTLQAIARTVKECSLCGLGQTCPNPVLTTLDYFRDEYEAHIKEKRCPAAVCDALMISPCQHTCPVGINVPQYLAHIAAGEYLEAINTIRERNPFPAICGRICHHPCERRCRRGELDESVAIRALKRFVADWYFDHASELPEPEPFPQTQSQKVAVVGAGPAGLSCAYFLGQMGYPVTVFEALPLGGGMLSVAIPEFRLPRNVIQSEIDYIASCGIEIRYDTPVTTSFTVDDLKRDGYEAIFIAAGAQRSQHIGIPGELEDITNFYYGLRFLRDVRLGKPVTVGRRVAVIGGGNVALDSARTALRLGADEVSIYYRRSREEMPVTEVEYDETIAEGVQVNLLVTPTRITSENWKVNGLQCTRMGLGEFDASGRRRPVPIVGSEFFVEADTVIAAVGQAPDLSFLPPDSALERTRWETLVVDDNTLVTNIPGIFAGGDFTTGPGMVIDAIAAGRRGAIAIDKYLKGDASPVYMYDVKTAKAVEVSPREEVEEEEEEVWEARPRLEVPTLPTQQRKQSFQEIELSFSEEQAREEAKRCLRCDLETT
ncbi:MAG: NADH-quinone oxidoreductase subunit NuoF [Dehalococcoidales bacterium]|nr:MAG: NADH-quinone oxidoreductase subunit NuoF [Dehalococcoidales bacterium]